MESDEAHHGDVPDGAEVSPLEENLAEDAVDASDNNVTSNEDAAVAEESGNLNAFLESVYILSACNDTHGQRISS